MDRPANTVATEFRHHVEALPADLALHFTTDMTGAETDAGDVHRFPECRLCAMGECLRNSGNWSDRHSNRGIRKKSIFHGDEIQLHEITIPQHSITRNTMNGFVIDANTHAPGKTINLARRRFGTML